MVRPDQAKFDQFSAVFRAVDAQLQEFAATNHLKYLQDVKRQPNRELHTNGNPLLMFGIRLDGCWYNMNYHEGLLYSVGATGVVWPTRILTTKSDERQVRQVPLLEHQPFDVIHENLGRLLEEWKQLVTSWHVPALASSDDVFEADGWQVTKKRERIKQAEADGNPTPLSKHL